MAFEQAVRDWIVRVVDDFFNHMVAGPLLPSPGPGARVVLGLVCQLYGWECQLSVELECSDKLAQPLTRQQLQAIYERHYRGKTNYAHTYYDHGLDGWVVDYSSGGHNSQHRLHVSLQTTRMASAGVPREAVDSE